MQEILTDYELIVDSAEQPRERPEEYKQQKKYYSGEKKNHTFKNQITVLPDGKDIVDIIAEKAGPKSDITLFREGKKSFNKNQKFQEDKGYEGEPSIKIPTKKPKKGELISSQKERNKELAAERIFVEHLIRMIKIFRVASERFRLHLSKYEKIIMTTCGLVRFPIGTIVFSI